MHTALLPTQHVGILYVTGCRCRLTVQAAGSPAADVMEVFVRYGESGKAVSVPATAQMSVSALTQLLIGKLADLPLGTPLDSIDAFRATPVAGTSMAIMSLPELDNCDTLEEAGITHHSHVVLLKSDGEGHAWSAVPCGAVNLITNDVVAALVTIVCSRAQRMTGKGKRGVAGAATGKAGMSASGGSSTGTP